MPNIFATKLPGLHKNGGTGTRFLVPGFAGWRQRWRSLTSAVHVLYISWLKRHWPRTVPRKFMALCTSACWTHTPRLTARDIAIWRRLSAEGLFPAARSHWCCLWLPWTWSRVHYERVQTTKVILRNRTTLSAGFHGWCGAYCLEYNLSVNTL